jgi:hypothetical protein
MAKVQKTFYLNEELNQLIEAITESTGASFTKIVTAALIQHLLGKLDRPDPRWMRLCHALETGTLTLPEVLVRIGDDASAESKEKLDNAPNRQFWVNPKKHPGDVNDTYTAWCRERYEMHLGEWRERRKQLLDASDRLQHMIKHWTRGVKPEQPDGRK